MVGQAGLLDLGYVGFYAVGAYTVALLTSPDSPWNKMAPNGFLHEEWAWLACVPLAMAVTAMAGLILILIVSVRVGPWRCGWQRAVCG